MATTEIRHTTAESHSRPLESLPGHELPPGLSPLPPSADYAFLSDCSTTALVAPSVQVAPRGRHRRAWRSQLQRFGLALKATR